MRNAVFPQERRCFYEPFQGRLNPPNIAITFQLAQATTLSKPEQPSPPTLQEEVTNAKAAAQATCGILDVQVWKCEPSIRSYLQLEGMQPEQTRGQPHCHRQAGLSAMPPMPPPMRLTRATP